MSVNCKLCKKTFTTRSAANRHIRKLHNMKTEAVYDKGVWSYQCLEDNCEHSFQQAKFLISHLEGQHDLKFETAMLAADTMEEFFKWKSSIERKYNCRYIFRTRYKTSTGESMYYNCNRSKTSYIPKADDQRKRSQKSQGSCKLGYSCTSQIKVTKVDDGYLIHWQKVHYGHDFELHHIRLTKDVRRKIYTKLAKGATPKMILQTTRENIKEEQLKRIDLLTAKDIRNIKNSYKTKSIDDHTYANEILTANGNEKESVSTEGKFLEGGVQKTNSCEALPENEIQEKNPEDEINEDDPINSENEFEIKEDDPDYLENDPINSENEFSESEHMEESPVNVNDEFPEMEFMEESSSDPNSDNLKENMPKEEIFIHIIEEENKKKTEDSPFFTEYVESDLEDPIKRHIYWIESQAALEKYRKENDDLLKSNSQMLNTIERLHDLVTELKKQSTSTSRKS